MKKKSAKVAQLETAEILSACERTRQRCNKLSDEERRELHGRALAIIYGQEANVPARRR